MMRIVLFSKRILIVGVFLFFGLLAGCAEKDVRQMQVESLCEGIIQSPDFSQPTKELAEKTLKNWSNNIVDPMPVMIYAGYAEHNDEYALMLVMSDEEFNLEGMTIHEKCLKSSNSVVEDYPLFKFKDIGSFQMITFTRRKEGQRKNDKEWEEYTVDDSMNTPRPVILASIPKEKELEVEIFIYDENGNKSNSVFLKPFINIPRTYLKK